MKYIIWDYNETCYVNYKGIAIEFKEESEAEDLIEYLVKVEVINDQSKDYLECRDNYLIEETK